jgi:hypothetical protein
MNLDVLFGAYIPLPPSGRFSEDTPFWAVALYGAGCVVTLVIMYGLIRKTRKEKLRQKRSAKKR